MAPQTLVLLGDSILDNGPYTKPEPDSTAHLQSLLPHWEVLRLAQDGAAMKDVGFQLRQLRSRPSTAVLSIGGNDAVEHIGVLDKRTSGSAEVLEALLAIAEDFAKRYENVARSGAEHAERWPGQAPQMSSTSLILEAVLSAD